jgi:hypothetical protein
MWVSTRYMRREPAEGDRDRDPPDGRITDAERTEFLTMSGEPASGL